MASYAGIDLHSNSNFLSVVDGARKIIEKRKLANDVQAILHPLAAYRDQLQGIAIESTFNWYWIVDALMDEGYRVHLANPAAIQNDTGRKKKGAHRESQSEPSGWHAPKMSRIVLSR